MKKLVWILKTEIFQNKYFFVLIFLTTFLLGISIDLALKAERKISELTAEDYWDADLAVLPKGISLIDFKNELLSGASTAFLPEALFETTLGIAKNQFQATALLALTDEKGSHVMAKGNTDPIGISWLYKTRTLDDWKEQQVYATPEWGNKLITGFLAKGSAGAMNSLKELIDKRTVGQAILIRQQVIHDQKIRQQLEQALGIYSGVLLGLIILSFFLLALWLRFRISKSLALFQELGFSKSISINLILQLFFLFALIPLLVGFSITEVILIL